MCPSTGTCQATPKATAWDESRGGEELANPPVLRVPQPSAQGRGSLDPVTEGRFSVAGELRQALRCRKAMGSGEGAGRDLLSRS